MTYGDVIGTIGLAVSVVGFGVTVWQLVRTANAAVATKDAIADVNRKMLTNHLLVLLPQMQSLESDLDSAISGGDRVGAIRALVTFSHTATQVAALLEAQATSGDQALIDELRSTAKSASANKAAIVAGATKPLNIVLKTISQQVASASTQCAGLATRYQSKAS